MSTGLNAPSYPVGLNELFQQPAGWNWDMDQVLSKFDLNLSAASELVQHSEVLLCHNLSKVQDDVVLLTMWAWLPLTSNPSHQAQFATWFGVDAAAVTQVYAEAGPLVLQPVARLQAVLERLKGLLFPQPNSTVIGLQIRTGATKFDKAARREQHEPEAVAHFVRCGYATLFATQRSQAVTWFVVADGSEVRHAALKRLGGVGGERKVHVVGVGLDVLEVSIGTAGSKVIFITNEVNSGTQVGVEMAVIEIWALGLSTQLIVSEDSSFADVSHGFFPKPTYTVTRAGQCYQLPTTEPIGPGLVYFKKQSCFNERMINPTWLWQNPESLHLT